MPEIAFVVSPRQNLFWTEIVDAVRHELGAIGVKSSCVAVFPPPRPDLVYALVPPHEWFALAVTTGEHPPPPPELLRRTLFLCGEQPGTSHFDQNVALAADAGVVFDLSRAAMREYERRGIAPAHFQLGYTAAWDRSDASLDRDVDIMFLGSVGPRRARHVGSYADSIWRKNCRIVFSDAGPHWTSAWGYLAGDDKLLALRGAKTLINVHQSDLSYFEWPRAIQAITNGCVLVTEQSVDHAPLHPGEHFVIGRAESLALLAHGLLEDEERRLGLARRAYEFIRHSLPLSDAVAEFASAAEEVARAPLPHWVPPRRPRSSKVAEVDYQPQAATNDPDMSALRRIAKDTALQVLDVRRTVEGLRREYLVGGAFPNVEVAKSSRGYAPARPRVSVLTAVYNHGQYLSDALSSVARGRYRSFELIVVDDGSTDASLERAKNWMDAHEPVPAILLQHPVNRGLPEARNAALAFARGEFAFVLDADNEIYPSGLARLVEALDTDPEAAFAYGLHQRFGADGPQGVENVLPWEPRRLRGGNYIDAMALMRVEALRELGGYATEPSLHGWEDYDLWCRMAEQGHRGVLVPQFVARYRGRMNSMLSLTGLSSTAAFATLVERSPNLMAGVEPPL